MLRPFTYLLLACCFLAAAFPGKAQGFPLEKATGRIYYSEEVLVMDGPHTDLYNRARTWLLAARPGPQALQVADAANGLLAARTYSLLPAAKGSKGQAARLWYTIHIQVQDDRYWYSLSDFALQWTPGPAAASKAGLTCPLEDFVLSRTPAPKPGTSKAGAAKPAPGPPAGHFTPDQVRKTVATLIQDLKASML